MDQSKSTKDSDSSESEKIIEPPRTYSTEFFVGLFTILSLMAAAYLSVGLGGLQILDNDRYLLEAEFDNVSGLEYGASVEIAGVPIGEVVDIRLEDPVAIVSMKIRSDLSIRDDDVFLVRTKGIIGDRYVKVSRGGSNTYLEPGARTLNTESVVDIEDIIGKIVHNFGGGDDEEKEDKLDLDL